ncbi:hypothetical protein ACF052_32455 [Streptomyces pilosus]|uniref:ATP-dependent DNA ligase n=1 Tax=Streptomyces pilosus TaxID=28893 RepID=UPI003702F919
MRLLRSRRGTEMGPAFPEVVSGTVQLPDATATHGELVVWDAAGRLAFERLQNPLARRGGAGAVRAARKWPAHFVAFDLLRLSGSVTTGWPYRRRRATLESVFAARRLFAPWALCALTTDPDTVREWLSWGSVGMEGVLQPGFGIDRLTTTLWSAALLVTPPSSQSPAQVTPNPVATPALDLYSHRMATEDENPRHPDITAMLKGQTIACKAARDAIVANGEVMLYDGQAPHWMVFGIAATRLRRSLRIGLTTLGLDETVEILRARHDEHLRTGNIVAADRSWFFTLYFDATGTELLACSGVKNERPSRRDGQESPSIRTHIGQSTGARVAPH